MFWSFETVASLTAQAVAAILSVMLYVFLVARVLPDLLLKPRYGSSAEGDRGLRRYRFAGGRAIVYAPSAVNGKYMKQYILSAHGEKKYIKCEFRAGVEAVAYDVVAFDGDGRILGTLRVEERISSENGCVSSAALLPMQTSCAKVSVRSINGVVLDGEELFDLPASRKWGYTAAVALGLAAEALMLRAVLMCFADQIFGIARYAGGFGGGLFAVITGLGAGVLLSGLLCRLFDPSEKKKRKTKKKR